MSVRIGCNLLWLVPGAVGGSEEATVALLREIAAQRPDDMHYTVYALDEFGAVYPDVAGLFETRLAPLTGRLKPLRVGAENTWLAAETRRAELDLVHHMNAVLPLVRRAPGVVTVHDLQPFDMPDNFHPVKRAYLHATVPRSVRKAAMVVAPSEFVRRGVIDRFDVPPERVRATPWGVEAPRTDLTVAEVQARYGLSPRWFVMNAVTWPHKNHATLVRAFATVAAKQHDVTLVLTGGMAQEEQVLAEQIDRLGLRGRVRRTGRIPRRDLLAIVRGAVALAFPSRYEGFGLPVLEAMSLGTPVVAADTTALPEVVGDAGLLLDPDDVDGWSSAMLDLLADGDERARLAAAGRRRARDFSWATTAAQTLQVYRDALPGVTS
ncbi:MAG TPA: glycosyltransferase family 1 protein [Acidimicrobiales bacterium]